jgi:hypothetical protein
MTAYEFWMPLVLLLVTGVPAVIYANWSAKRLEARNDPRTPAE